MNFNVLRKKYFKIGQRAFDASRFGIAPTGISQNRQDFFPTISDGIAPASVNSFGFDTFAEPNNQFISSDEFIITNNNDSFRGSRIPIPGRSGTQTTTQTTGTTTVVTTTTVQGSTFSKFLADDVISQQTEIVTGGVWSTGAASLTTHWSSSAQTTTQRRYYTEVYDSNPASSDSVAQYSIAYGHALGSGSDSQGQLNDSPSRAIYSQFRNLLFPAGTSRFTTYGSGSTNSIYAITFNRNRLKERLDPGNFEIPLQRINTRATNATGSVTLTAGTVYTLIDDSSINTGSFTATGGRVYNLVSGSITSGVFNSAAPIYYGVVYPDYGTVIVDGNVIDQKLNFATGVASSVEANNHFAMFRSISGSGTQINGLTGDAFGFQARNSEKITSTHYFVRVKNGQFNYTNNPTFITGSTGDITNSFLTDPVTYITTIGLYNDQQELLAVAKVSKPILKSFSKESLIRVKLDF